MAINVLLSYAGIPGTLDFDALRDILVCGRLMIDSGAFSVFTSGKVIDRLAYAEFLERWSGRWDHAITLDVIGDPAATRANTRWLHDRGLPVMPVFTIGGALADFDAMVAESGYVCVGGLVGMPKTTQEPRIAMLQRRAQRLGGGIHTLGVATISSMNRCRVYSGDSTAIVNGFRFGMLATFNGKRVAHVDTRKRTILARDRDMIRAHGIDLAAVLRDGRMPVRGEPRNQMAQAMSLGLAAADEFVKRHYVVPSPTGLEDPGPHLYNAWGSAVATELAPADLRIHTPGADLPRVWMPWHDRHRHTARYLTRQGVTT